MEEELRRNGHRPSRTAGSAARHGRSALAANRSASRVRSPSRATVDAPTEPTAEPPAQRQRLAVGACCDCTRFSTCQSMGTNNRHGCPCRIAGRKCVSCACWRQCRNKALLGGDSAATAGPQKALTAFFGKSETTATTETTTTTTTTTGAHDNPPLAPNAAAKATPPLPQPTGTMTPTPTWGPSPRPTTRRFSRRPTPTD
jgi:hypothetical protein